MSEMIHKIFLHSLVSCTQNELRFGLTELSILIYRLLAVLNEHQIFGSYAFGNPVAVVKHELLENWVLVPQVGKLQVHHGDVHFVPRDGLDDLPFEALHVQAEVIHPGVADGQQDRVERETGCPERIKAS